MTWPGGKNGSGVYQRIINLMPPHETYVELFCGSGAVLRHKRPADLNVIIDKSEEAIRLTKDLWSGDGGKPHCWLYPQCAIEWLVRTELDQRTLIYADPPYLMETRKGGDIYEHEMSDGEHRALLHMLTGSPAMVMLSGYRSPLYDEELADWHRVDYRTQTRQGMVDESLWMNFTPPDELHDYRYLGENFRERERIKRKKARWAKKIANMDRLERLAIMETLKSVGERV